MAKYYEPNKLEIYFSRDLDMNNIKYDFQSVSNNIDKKFYDLYTEKDNPFHIWDFKIKCKDQDIFIDVDGSIHSVKSGEYITKKGLDVGKRIEYRDTRRLYQTGGLQSYIILAYHDKINNDTPVLDVKIDHILHTINY